MKVQTCIFGKQFIDCSLSVGIGVTAERTSCVFCFFPPAAVAPCWMMKRTKISSKNIFVDVKSSHCTRSLLIIRKHSR